MNEKIGNFGRVLREDIQNLALGKQKVLLVGLVEKRTFIIDKTGRTQRNWTGVNKNFRQRKIKALGKVFARYCVLVTGEVGIWSELENLHERSAARRVKSPGFMENHFWIFLFHWLVLFAGLIGSQKNYIKAIIIQYWGLVVICCIKIT